MSNEFLGQWEQRWHPLRQEWVVYSAHRNARPWSGALASASEPVPEYLPDCYLCPRNKRANGKVNPDYKGVYIFDNDFPVVGDNAPPIDPAAQSGHPALFKKTRADGIARVVCYDPRHNVTLADVLPEQATNVFLAWREQMQEFKNNPAVEFALIFENHGAMVGVSNPHPHCQIYATNFTFALVEQELRAARQFDAEYNKNIFSEILSHELESGERIITENDNALSFVPYFARYAYEVMIFPKKRHATLATMSDDELHDLAACFQDLVRRYDGLYGVPFPYVMSILQAPVDHGNHSPHHLHLLLQPPLRQPGLQKFLAGPEIGGGNFMADTMPEVKAEELRRVKLDS
ncbi:MAG: galactose-1-phosphate uridylyltransferase [Candidatus Hinthialibacter antarcticus]|nr:galactose-1-phosphate uridylyltransferase [Candidatus Hinthialibacter antarcticus]